MIACKKSNRSRPGSKWTLVGTYSRLKQADDRFIKRLRIYFTTSTMVWLGSSRILISHPINDIPWSPSPIRFSCRTLGTSDWSTHLNRMLIISDIDKPIQTIAHLRLACRCKNQDNVPDRSSVDTPSALDLYKAGKYEFALIETWMKLCDSKKMIESAEQMVHAGWGNEKSSTIWRPDHEEAEYTVEYSHSFAARSPHCWFHSHSTTASYRPLLGNPTHLRWRNSLNWGQSHRGGLPSLPARFSLGCIWGTD